MHTELSATRKSEYSQQLKFPKAVWTFNVIYVMEHFLCGLRNKSKATQVQSSSPLSLSYHGHHSCVVPAVVDFPI